MTDNFDEKVDKIIDRLVQKIETMISTKADISTIQPTITQSVDELRNQLLQKESNINSRLDVFNRRISDLENLTLTRAAQASAPVPVPANKVSDGVLGGSTVVANPVDLSTVIDPQKNELYNQWMEKILVKITTNEELKNNLNVKIPTHIKESKNQPNFAENLFLILLCIYYKASDSLSITNINKIKGEFNLESLYDDSRSLKEEYDKTLDHIGGLLNMGKPQTLKSKLQAIVYPEKKGK
jgi:hypothetical protein